MITKIKSFFSSFTNKFNMDSLDTREAYHAGSWYSNNSNQHLLGSPKYQYTSLTLFYIRK